MFPATPVPASSRRPCQRTLFEQLVATGPRSSKLADDLVNERTITGQVLALDFSFTATLNDAPGQLLAFRSRLATSLGSLAFWARCPGECPESVEENGGVGGSVPQGVQGTLQAKGL